MKISSNSIFDKIINNLDEKTISVVFGKPAIGKTTLTYLYLIDTIKKGRKVIYIDTEGGFSIERVRQLNSEIDIKNILIFSPKSFEEQEKTILKLNKYLKSSKNIGLVIIDSLVMLYRLKLGDEKKHFQKINSSLGEQLRLLTQISRSFNIPILATNQMYKIFDENSEEYKNKMVGGLTIEYWAKTIIELDDPNGIKTATLIKHKFKPKNQIKYEIVNNGFKETKRKGFNFFN